MADELMKENFDLADSDGDGFLSKEEVVLLFRALGQTVSDSKMKTATSDISDLTDFSSFKLFFTKHYQEPATPEDVMKAFTIFDPKRTGNMSVKKFRELVTSIGDSLTHAEVDEILKVAGIGAEPEFAYSTFARLLALGPAQN